MAEHKLGEVKTLREILEKLRKLYEIRAKECGLKRQFKPGIRIFMIARKKLQDFHVGDMALIYEDKMGLRKPMDQAISNS